MNYLIDIPSPFASKEEWQAFLNEMLAITDKTPEVLDAIRQAQDALSKFE